MYSVKNNIDRLYEYVIDSSRRIDNVFEVNMQFANLTNFVERGYNNRIYARDVKLIITDIFSESFRQNRTGLLIEKPQDFNENYFAPQLLKYYDDDKTVKFEIEVWRKDEPYDEVNDDNFIIWKLEARSFEMKWDSFLYD